MRSSKCIRNQVIPALFLKHEVHMRWPPRMSPQELQQLPYWPVVRNRVRHRDNSLEPKHSMLVALHHAPPIWAVTDRMLHIIVACGIRFPDIDLHAWDRVSGNILDRAEDQAWLAALVL